MGPHSPAPGSTQEALRSVPCSQSMTQLPGAAVSGEGGGQTPGLLKLVVSGLPGGGKSGENDKGKSENRKQVPGDASRQGALARGTGLSHKQLYPGLNLALQVILSQCRHIPQSPSTLPSSRSAERLEPHYLTVPCARSFPRQQI